MRRAYGGVVIDLCGQVLLRKPVDAYRGVVWTFAKGKPRWGESPEETALREVREETGVCAKVLSRIPGCFAGARSSNEYFLMLPLEITPNFDCETLAVRWAAREEAVSLIWLTTKPNRRARDLKLLAAAFRSFYLSVGIGGESLPVTSRRAAPESGRRTGWRQLAASVV